MDEMLEAARAELARRELARRHLLDFAEYTLPGYQRARHLETLAGHLEAVERGEERRLMVFMPPRHGKSELVSVRFPAWYLGRNPNARVILTSYAGSLATGFSRQVRNVVQGQEYQAVFGERAATTGSPVAMAQDSRAADEWNLAWPHRGGMVAAGVGGGITGRGADLLIIDDPVKDRAEAESGAVRDAVWRWYTSTAYTRLEEGAAIVLVMTRWHEDDLAGRLLKQMAEDSGADQWKVIQLQALTGKGKRARALWPEKYGVTALEAIRANIGSYDFEALYQQQPQPPGGWLIRAEWFQQVDAAPPEGIRWMRYWDLAVSTKSTADYTASIRVGLADDGVLYLVDGLRGRWEWPEVRRRIVEVARGEPGTTIGVEAVAFQLAAWQDLMREPGLVDRQVLAVQVSRDKVSRALPWVARAEAGKVRLVRGPWMNAFLSEAAMFPNGRHDDWIDSVSGAVQALAGSSWLLY